MIERKVRRYTFAEPLGDIAAVSIEAHKGTKGSYNQYGLWIDVERTNGQKTPYASRIVHSDFNSESVNLNVDAETDWLKFTIHGAMWMGEFNEPLIAVSMVEKGESESIFLTGTIQFDEWGDVDMVVSNFEPLLIEST